MEMQILRKNIHKIQRIQILQAQVPKGNNPLLCHALQAWSVLLCNQRGAEKEIQNKGLCVDSMQMGKKFGNINISSGT